MPNRQLTSEELEHLFAPLISVARSLLLQLAHDDADLHWALRRKLAKELTYDERSNPNARRKLKALKRKEQRNKCAVCTRELPPSYNTLDRLEAMKGYTSENTQLICQKCDIDTQRRRGYK
jgi:ribosomal protein L44E